MPLPKPEKNQKRTDFVNSCMDNSAMLKEFPDSEQRAAVCYSRFDKKAKASITGDLSGEIVIDLTPLIKAKEMARKSINDLPDSDFAYIQPGGKKEDGKTVPRSLRHLPIHDAAHVRNALARLSQTKISPDAKAKALKKIKSAAKKFGIKMAESGSSHRSEPLEEHFKDMRDRLHYKMDEQDSYDAKHETLREWREHHQGAIKNIDNEIASLKKDKGEDKQDVKDES
jgi:hypothetical protein|tara:strand:- start:5663 stop:6343 length:681 start_codon:yes stop_codon:yes gene_type:complete